MIVADRHGEWSRCQRCGYSAQITRAVAHGGFLQAQSDGFVQCWNGRECALRLRRKRHSESEPQRLLCQRVSDTFPQRDGVKSGLDQCSQCGEHVRVADTSREAIKIYAQAEIWCLDCRVQNPPLGGVAWEYSDAQIAEIARVTGKTPAEIVEQLAAVLPSLRKQGSP